MHRLEAVMLTEWLRQREADSIFITSYRLQANVAGLTDNGEVQIWYVSRDASKQRKAEREQLRKLRRRNESGTLKFNRLWSELISRSL